MLTNYFQKAFKNLLRSNAFSLLSMLGLAIVISDFAQRTDVSWWIFIVASCIAIFIALATVCFQAIKAALSNLVKTLRTE